MIKYRTLIGIQWDAQQAEIRAVQLKKQAIVNWVFFGLSALSAITTSAGPVIGVVAKVGSQVLESVQMSISTAKRLQSLKGLEALKSPLEMASTGINAFGLHGAFAANTVHGLQKAASVM
jgi:hypothetical protein